MAEEKKQSRGKSAVSSVGQQALGVGARRLAGQVLSKAGAAAGSFFGPIGTGIGVAVGWAAGNKYVIGLIGGVAVFIFIILPVIIIVLIFGFGGSEPVAAEEEEILSVTKTASPPQIKKNAPPTEVTYKITAKNITANTTLEEVKVSDGFLGLDKTIGDLGPGDTHTETVKHTITDTSEDKIVTNIVTVTGTLPGAPPSADGLNYYILYGDTSIEPVNPEGIKAFANSRYPDNNVDKPCPGGVTCWDYVIAQSKTHKISPAFAIAIWWEEGGFGGLVNGGRSSAQFGCGYYPDNFIGAFNCFLDFTSETHPYDSVDPMGSFTEWVRYFCGPQADPICSNNPNFISSLEDIYGGKDLAPGKIVYVSNGQNPGSEETVTATASATVIIGNPPQGPPAYAPLKNGVYLSGYDFTPPSHIGVDIATYGSDWNIYSPFAGVATVSWIDDDGDGGNNFGVYMDLTSGGFTVRMAHLVRGSVRVKIGDVVNTGEPIAVMGCTGTCYGSHIHYVMWKAEELVNPKDYGALTDHP